MNNIQIRSELVDINHLLLDWENPRLKSRYRDEYRSINELEREKVLICNLVAYYDVEEIIQDIYVNTLASQHVFFSDLVIIQETSISDKFFVKEGNRRVCSLKIINDYVCNNGKLLEEVHEFMSKSNLYELDLEKKFIANKNKILNFLLANDGDYINRIPCNIYGYDDESSLILKNVLRRMHIRKKKTWSAIDKRLFDYESIENKIKNGVNSVEEAINQLLDEEKNITNEAVTIGLMQNRKSEFLTTAFYSYLKQEIQIGKLGDQNRLLQERLTNSFLPICEVFRKGMDYILGIEFSYLIESNQIVYEFSQKVGFPEIKNMKKLVDECVLKILNPFGKKAISNTQFKVKKNELILEDKTKTDFWIFFSDILKEFVDFGEYSKNNTNQKTKQAGIFLKDNLNGKKLKYYIPSAPMELLSKVDRVIDTNGNDVNINNLSVFINGRIVSKTNNQVYIGSIINPQDLKITYQYTDDNDKKIVAELDCSFVSKFKMSNDCAEKLFNELASADKIIIPELKEQLINEVNKLNVTENKNVVALIIRCFYELSTRSLFSYNQFDPLFKHNNGFHDMTHCIENLSNYIYNSFDTKKKCLGMEKYYNLNADTIKNNLTSQTCNYFDNYKKTHAAHHANFSVYSEKEILDLGKFARNWVYIVNYIYYCAKNNLSI